MYIYIYIYMYVYIYIYIYIVLIFRLFSRELCECEQVDKMIKI